MKKLKQIPEFIVVINYFGKINGSTWINIWGLSALVKFWLGQNIDWAFIGVLGLYTSHKLVSKFVPNGDSSNE